MKAFQNSTDAYVNRLRNIAERLANLSTEKLQSFWSFIGGEGEPGSLLDAIWMKASDETRNYPLVQRSYPHHNHGYVRASDKRDESWRANQESWLKVQWEKWEEIDRGGRVYEVHHQDYFGKEGSYPCAVLCVWADTTPDPLAVVKRFDTAEQAEAYLTARGCESLMGGLEYYLG